MANPDWKVGFLRLTTFVPPSIAISDPGWWEKYVGQPPQTRTSKPMEGSQVATGPWLGGVGTLSMEPARIDWRADATDASLEASTLPSLGDFGGIGEKFREFGVAWLGEAPPSIRLAFGALLLIPVKDRHEGYESVAKYLKDIKLDSSDSEDFLYQINRPRVSKICPGLKINRLTKWSVGMLRGLSLSVVAGKKDVFANASVGSSFSFCRLELDINSDGETREQIGSEILPKLFAELVGLARETSTEGDIK